MKQENLFFLVKERKFYFLKSTRSFGGRNWRRAILDSHSKRPFTGIFGVGKRTNNLWLDLKTINFEDTESPAFQPNIIVVSKTAEPQNLIDALEIIPQD